MNQKKISMAVIKRLPRYYRYLNDLLKMDIKRISSKELSVRMGITASQIRQDLNCFGGFGPVMDIMYNHCLMKSKNFRINSNFNSIIVGFWKFRTSIGKVSNFEKDKVNRYIVTILN